MIGLVRPISLRNHPASTSTPDLADCYQLLLGRLKTKIQNGEITERGLARASGISQPHIHNGLKGLRQFSFPLTSALMRAAKLSVYDLLDYEAPRPGS